MASKLTRYTAKLFGSTASGVGANSIAQFGSLAAASPMRYSGAAITPALVQALSNFLGGWPQAIMSGNAIALEDLTALDYLWSYQICYILQEGIPEYDSGTIYWTGSLCSSGGAVYVSLQDDNIGNALTSQSYWKLQNSGMTTQTSTYSILATDEMVRLNTTSGGFTATLLQASTLPLGKTYIVKNVGTGGNAATLAAYAGDTFDQLGASLNLDSTPTNESVTIRNNGSGWDII